MTVKIIANGEKLKTSHEYGLRLIEQGKAVFLPDEAPAPVKPKKKDEKKGEAE